jgi:hypothetical protein
MRYGGAKVREFFQAPTPSEAKFLLAMRGMLDNPDENRERSRAFRSHAVEKTLRAAAKRSRRVRKNRHLPPKFRPKRSTEKKL